MKKKNMIIIGVIALILVVAVGYAIFSDTLTINGSATAKGDFSLSYSCKEDLSAFDEDSGEGECSVEGSNIKMKSSFSKPNEFVLFHVTVTNDGTIPAVLKEVTSPNNKGKDGKVEGDLFYVDNDYSLMAYYGVTIDGEEEAIMGDSDIVSANIILQPGEKIDIAVVHSWADSDTLGLESQPELPEEGVTLTYDLTFKFQQAQN